MGRSKIWSFCKESNDKTLALNKSKTFANKFKIAQFFFNGVENIVE